ncbi:MAG TPA: AraC family transcriptional regulator [Oceanospirillales bacterium]|nr:AraC family transcriptional regulator [Oceanospirillaceae bacterium]HBS42020.1 AraC family transcriptional regulator [Oceanospirillales bacterium]|tara:strand:+ start:1056 stop:1889 length:834 start_codon:yes stop_codon:yes gene_type:complete
MDTLADILNRFSISARVFFSGNLCGIQSFGDGGGTQGHLHLLKAGPLAFINNEGHKIVLDRPAVIFIPRAFQHRIIANESVGAELVCANIFYEDGQSNPLAGALPKLIYFDLEESGLLGQAASWLFEEAFSEQSGRQPMIDRLCDIFLIQILRHVLSEGIVQHGMIAGLSHPQIAKALTAIHQQPELPWTLESLAAKAAMSRTRFAEQFREIVGQTPGDYIADWRVAVAQGLLRKNKPVGLIANEVGYENGSALARVFRKRTGLSPKEWLEKAKSQI